MISLQTNVDSLDALSNLNNVNAAQGKTIQQLSSGFRINSSGDDAAGLAVANGYQNQITQLQQGVNNANDGIAQLQIIDGGLGNISNILNRMQTLATESATDTFTGNRATLNQEFQNLIGEITRQADSIGLKAGDQFNAKLNVFIGGASLSATPLTTGTVVVDLSGATNAVDATSLGVGTSAVDTTANAQAAITAIGAAVKNLGLVQGAVGAGENQLSYAVGLAQSQITNFSTAEGAIKDTDVAAQASNLTRNQVLEQTSVAALAQANAMPQAVLKLLQ